MPPERRADNQRQDAKSAARNSLSYDPPQPTRTWRGLPVAEDVVSGLPGGAPLGGATSQERYTSWLATQGQRPTEYLLPRIVRDTTPEWPTFMARRAGGAGSDLRATVDRLAPWSVPYLLADGIDTISQRTLAGQVTLNQLLFRRAMITGTVAALLGEELATSTVLDVGCNAGFFSLDAAGRGARHVDGIDLRTENIEQARFVADHYGIRNASFEQMDVDALPEGEQWDVVLNLGLLYHVTNPLELVCSTYDRCQRFAIIDTVVHKEPISAYILFADKDVESRTEGRSEWEFHPTYRAVIDTMAYAGFREVFEIVSAARPAHHLYAHGQRRCFLGAK
jgi:SAM-dependent methyltransferase